jgi:hypothetical protein
VGSGSPVKSNAGDDNESLPRERRFVLTPETICSG